MLRRHIIPTVVLSALFSVLIMSNAEAQKKSTYRNPPAQGGDVEYNATEKSPTLPLVQTPPPQNYPNSVQVGVPSYYYYYYPPVAPYGGGGYYGGAPAQAGVNFYNSGGQTRRSFWYNTSIPGQVAPYGAGGYGGGYGGGFPGGYGPGGSGGYGPSSYGPGGFYPPYNGGTLYMP